MSRDEWFGWIQDFLEARVQDAPDESCKTFAENLLQVHARRSRNLTVDYMEIGPKMISVLSGTRHIGWKMSWTNRETPAYLRAAGRDAYKAISKRFSGV